MRALVIKLIIFPLLDDDRYIHYMYAPIALSANLVFMIICTLWRSSAHMRPTTPLATWRAAPGYADARLGRPKRVC